MPDFGRMKPKTLVTAWVEAFNRGDANALAAFYTADAVSSSTSEV
jgi:ketosteroid isomerase-like protein